MNPLQIFISPDIDRTKAYGLFSQLQRGFEEKSPRFEEVLEPNFAHVAIMDNDGEVIDGNPPSLLRFSLHSSRATSYRVRLIHPDDIMSRLFEYSQLLQRHQVLPRDI